MQSKEKLKAKTEEEKNNSSELRTRDKVIAGVAVVGAGVAVVGAAALAYGISKLFSGSGDVGTESGTDERETMVAPGKGDGTRIFRDDFEKDPRSYFRNLRKK
ncbi:hypothetical protein LINPERHAP2_LOCUS10058 [Linum perenne]